MDLHVDGPEDKNAKEKEEGWWPGGQSTLSDWLLGVRCEALQFQIWSRAKTVLMI